MKRKIHKYLIYILKFIKSPNKKTIIKELTLEIKDKGIITGIKSLLHKKIHLKGNYYYNLHYRGGNILVGKFDKSTKVILPAVIEPLVSIVIPMYNQLEFTCNCVYSIFKNNDFKNYEIIIADDNSTENSNLLEGYFEHIVLIKNDTNLGFVKNCNNAALNARGKYIVFLNNDTQVQKNWLSELLAIFENFPNAGLAGSKLIYPDGHLQEAGGIIWQDGSGWNYGNRDDPSKPEYNYVKEADYISGASIMVPKTLWNELGGFDELYAPAYYEDTDLCFRVRAKGCKVYYQPFSEVVHFEGVSHGKDLKKGIKQYQAINQRKFVERWQHELQKKSPNGVSVFSERDRTTHKKHVLVVDHYLPEIDKDAGSRCISNFIDSMIDLDYNVKFLGENQNSLLHYQKLFQEKGVEVLYGNEFNFFDESWKNYLKTNLYNFEVVLLSRSSVCSPIMTFLRNNSYEGNIIYFGHDLGFRRMEKEAHAKGDAQLEKQAKMIKAEEDFMYSKADNSLVLSCNELDYLSKYITTPLHYIPGYFFEVVQDIVPYDDRDGILFIGGFNHPPNQDAMLWFLDEIYEPLYKQNIGLTIVGSKMPEFIFKAKERFVSLNILSDISDDELNDLYAKTKIAVVPLRFGAGVKGKVIEAMSKGVPVIGTDIAFEGMPKDDTFLYKGVNSSYEIREEILVVYSDKKRWEKLSEFGKRYVRDNFNKESMKRVFKNIIG